MSTDVPWYQNVLNNLTQAGTAYLTLAQQKQLNDINLERARQGLAPLDASQYQAGINVGVGSATRNTLVIIVGVVVGGWILTNFIGRKRR